MHLTPDEVHEIIQTCRDNPLALLEHCGGYYSCPRDEQGRRRGPLVGYTGRDSQGRQFVGEVYVNVAAAEQYPTLMYQLAQCFSTTRLNDVYPKTNVFCGAPEGGKTLASMLALIHSRRYSYPEKRVTAVATLTSREQCQLEFGRHTVLPGEGVVLVEDVLNNFQTTQALVDVITDMGGYVLAIVAVLYRSDAVDSVYQGPIRSIPVISLVRQRLPQYTQDHPAVRDDVQGGNVVWKPKQEWARLAAAMRDQSRPPSPG